MAVNIDIEPRFKPIKQEFLRSIAEKTMNIMGIEKSEISLVITTNDKITKLNREYLNHDRPTDVISFIMNEHDPETGLDYLGDVVISGEMAKEQSDDLGHSLKKELAVLIIHGILHLAGFDDKEKAKRKQMMAEQEKILEEVFNEK